MTTQPIEANPTVLSRLASPLDPADQRRAALELCRRVRPGTIDALVVLLVPERDGKREIRFDVFDALADGLESWREEVARRLRKADPSDPIR